MAIFGEFIAGNIFLPDELVGFEKFDDRFTRQCMKAEKLAVIFDVPKKGYFGKEMSKEDLKKTLEQNGIISEGYVGKLKTNILLMTGFYTFCFSGPKKETWNWYEFCSLKNPEGSKVYRLERKELSTI